ncbi:hypothetical protein RHSIM_RhsimUnG0223000 [Rhododendron simsii]|uniref:Lachrymatory-factor synthase n=1 Tax=Rhododendron simsii TaxID=118357 RepID=A0A834L3U3_RHOSS|nr:hypothetical protein RHSIM_RhsimUnG0223000 [Rhododendron simsii]
MEEGSNPKWEGKATANLVGSTPEQVWPLLEDFCNLNKYLTTLDTCYRVEGELGKPGLIRYCGATVPSLSGGDEKLTLWCHEKLLAMDPIGRLMTYVVLDNNMGFKSYESTIKLLPIDGDDEPGCRIEWSFVTDPVEGNTQEDLVNYLDSSVRTMAMNMGNALKSLWKEIRKEKIPLVDNVDASFLGRICGCYSFDYFKVLLVLM